MQLTKADGARVGAAIAAGEASSDGEILAIATDLSDPYHDVALHYAVLVLFIALALFAAWPRWLDWWWTTLFGWGQPTQRDLLTLLLGLVLAKFLGTLLVMRWRPLRLLLTPGATKARRVRRRATALFKASLEARTRGRTAVLIYLSLGEKRAEIIGDAAITAATDPQEFVAAMDALLSEVRAGRAADGIVAAIGLVGAVLATHFPRSADDTDEIPDRLILL